MVKVFPPCGLGQFCGNELDVGPQESKREYDRRYYLLNKDKKDSLVRQYHVRNKDKISAAKRAYYSLNKRDLTNANRTYHARNADRVRELKREFYVRHRDHDNLAAYNPRHTDKALRSWRTPEQVRDFFDSIAPQLQIVQHGDWYRVSREQICELGGKTLYSKFENLGGALRVAYPDINWDLTRFTHVGKKAGQRRLRVKLAELMPGLDLVEEYEHPELSWEGSERNIELDLWIPKFRIALEYQGEHHFYSLENAFGPNGTASLYSERDLAKHTLCRAREITLITIPYWWDGAIDSLTATLYQARPDVFPASDASPISSEPPRSYSKVCPDASDLISLAHGLGFSCDSRVTGDCIRCSLDSEMEGE